MSNPKYKQDRRQFNSACAAGAALLTLPRIAIAPQESADNNQREDEFALKYLLASCMYGYMYLGEILPEVAATGSLALDIWPKVHGNAREQLEDFGEEKYLELLGEHNVATGCITQYKLGPFQLQDEMRLAARLGCKTIVTSGRGPAGLSGDDLKNGVIAFVEQMKPHLDVAEETGVTIAIENHGNNLFESAESLKWLAEVRCSEKLAIALAPYHLPQDTTLLAGLIRTLGPAIEVFYAWQHGLGCHERLPKEQELLQMPGRGELDFKPLLEALREIDYAGWTEIFMHPVPRGIPILETTAAVTAEINTSRNYLQQLLDQ